MGLALPTLSGRDYHTRIKAEEAWIMDQTDLPYLSLTEFSWLIESKKVSPVEVTQAYLDRIDGSALTTLNILKRKL